MNRQQEELTQSLLLQAALALAALAFFYLMTGCSPYAEIPGTATPSPAATATESSYQVENLKPTPRPSCVIATGYKAGTVNLRSDAGMSYAVIGLLREGDRLTIIQAGIWIEVETSQHVTGWVNARYCEAQR